MALHHSLKAQILRQYSHIIQGKIKITEHFFKVPLDYSKPSGESIRLFARSAERFKKPVAVTKDADDKLPWFLFLAGGPGFGNYPVQAGGWQDFIMDKGYKVLMLDTRGNGLSNTITTELLQTRGSPEQQANYLKFFRADNIVNDSEAIRLALTEDYPEDKKKWSVMGQSFGGFCTVHYLSTYPDGLREAFTTGGLPPLVRQPDAVYAKLMKRAQNVSRQYYEKFPEDIARMHRIVKHISNENISTPNGGQLLPERIQNFGMGLGFSRFSETLHDIIMRLDNDLEMFGEFSRPSLATLDQQSPFDSHILYALVHEPCYLQGAAGNWSAERMMKTASGFNASEVKKDEPINFTLEMVTHNTYHAHPSLKSLLPVAEILAKDTDWPDLYNEAQLAANEVPLYSVTYFDDHYVDFDFAQETASKIKGCKQFITNRLLHDGLRADNKQVMEQLFKLRDDVDF